jgi:hypothetical protein
MLVGVRSWVRVKVNVLSLELWENIDVWARTIIWCVPGWRIGKGYEVSVVVCTDVPLMNISYVSARLTIDHVRIPS